MNRLIVTAVFVLVILVAGCAGASQDTAPVGESPSSAMPVTDSDPVVDEMIVVDTPDVESEPEVAPECTVREDCTDDNTCTTDACRDGQCIFTLEPGCRSEESSDPSIVSVNTADDDEWVRIEAKNARIGEWTLQDDDGNVFKFGKNYILNNFIVLHTKSGIGSTQDLYWGKKEFVWEDNDTITLTAKNGTVVSSWP